MNQNAQTNEQNPSKTHKQSNETQADPQKNQMKPTSQSLYQRLQSTSKKITYILPHYYYSECVGSHHAICHSWDEWGFAQREFIREEEVDLKPMEPLKPLGPNGILPYFSNLFCLCWVISCMFFTVLIYIYIYI